MAFVDAFVDGRARAHRLGLDMSDALSNMPSSSIPFFPCEKKSEALRQTRV
jgi:hypothetical protein